LLRRQLFFAPSRIQVRIALRSQVDSFFLPCGIGVAGEPRHRDEMLAGIRLP
jgi:hypothetical protein